MANVKSLKDMVEETDDDKRQAYYAGGQGQHGSGGSGQEVLDPRDFMKRAKEEMGAQSAAEWQAGQPAGPSAFSGAGQSMSGNSTDADQAASKPQEHTIIFWQNGFTVNDGPLRNAQDPENAAFLADVNRGRMPAELAGVDGAAEGDVHLTDRSGEPYVPPPVKLDPFGGSGRSMRATPAEGAAAPPTTTAAELVLDEGKPTTTLQIRLHDGSRKVVKANHTHTVLQLRQHIATLTPGVSFELSTTFPRKKLEEMEKTLSEAELLNQTVVQTSV